MAWNLTTTRWRCGAGARAATGQRYGRGRARRAGQRAAPGRAVVLGTTARRSDPGLYPCLPPAVLAGHQRRRHGHNPCSAARPRARGATRWRGHQGAAVARACQGGRLKPGQPRQQRRVARAAGGGAAGGGRPAGAGAAARRRLAGSALQRIVQSLRLAGAPCPAPPTTTVHSPRPPPPEHGAEAQGGDGGARARLLL